MRYIDPPTLAALVSQTVRPALLAAFSFSGGWLRVWSGIGDLFFEGQVYRGIGNFGGVSPVEETGDVSARGLRFQLSGVPSDLISGVLSQGYRGRECRLWLGAFNAGRTGFVGEPVTLFRGVMDTCEIEDTGEMATIAIQAENRLALLRRARTVRYTHDQQEARFPGDRGLEFIAKQSEAPIYWGIPSIAAASAGYSGGGSNPGGYSEP